MNKDITKPALLRKIAETSPYFEHYIGIHHPILDVLKTDFFKNSTLDIERVISLITTSPTEREGERRLTGEQQKEFVKLISKNEEDRTETDLYNAGIIRPDFQLEYVFEQISKDLPYIRTNGFLEEWLKTGYLDKSALIRASLLEMPNEGSYFTVSKIKNMDIINMSYAIIEDSSCNVQNFFLPNARLDNVGFYKAMFNDAILDGATMHNSSVEDCNGYRDNDYPVAEKLIECGVLGLSLDNY